MGQQKGQPRLLFRSPFHNLVPNPQFRTQLEDQLHFFVEECDTLQGFHLLCDWSNGFGGLGSCIAQDLRDEYGNKGILTFLSSPLDTPLDKVGVASCKMGVASCIVGVVYRHCAAAGVLFAGVEPSPLCGSSCWAVLCSGPPLSPLPAMAVPSLPLHCVFPLSLLQCECLPLSPLFNVDWHAQNVIRFRVSQNLKNKQVFST